MADGFPVGDLAVVYMPGRGVHGKVVTILEPADHHTAWWTDKDSGAVSEVTEYGHQVEEHGTGRTGVIFLSCLLPYAARHRYFTEEDSNE